MGVGVMVGYNSVSLWYALPFLFEFLIYLIVKNKYEVHWQLPNYIEKAVFKTRKQKETTKLDT